MFKLKMLLTVFGFLFSITPAYSQDQIPVSIDLNRNPALVSATDGNHLVYELIIQNHNRRSITLINFEVLSGADVVFSASQESLPNLITQPGKKLSGAETLVVEGGNFAVIFLDLLLKPESDLPLTHRISAKVGDDEEIRIMEVNTSQIAPAIEKVLNVARPLRGERWLVYGGLNNEDHRRSLIALNGKAKISQRFAIDFVLMGEDGTIFSGDPTDNESWHGYGQEIISVFDGVVAAVNEGVPENSPGTGETAVPITLETIGGNYVVVSNNAGQFAFYAHMQPGSVKVHVGDQVQKGQVLGLVGNSGASDAPHLHFHVTDSPSPLGAEGIEFTFSNFSLREITGDFSFFETGEPFQFLNTEHPAVQNRMLPLNGSIVDFPD